MVLSELTVIRKVMFDFMKKNSKDIESATSLSINASPKLKELMKLLSKVQRTDICLVFVDRRTTAKILYHYIKVPSKNEVFLFTLLLTVFFLFALGLYP